MTLLPGRAGRWIWLPSAICLPLWLPWLLTARAALPKDLPRPLPERLAPFAVFLQADGGVDSPLLAEAILDQAPPDPAGPVLLDRWRSFGAAPGEDPELDAPELTRALAPLRAAGREVIQVRAPMTAWRLRGASLLVINLPMGDRRGYTHGEILAIAAFVRRGGGLLLIGDGADRFFHIEMLADLQRALGFTLLPVTAAADDPAALLAPDVPTTLRLGVPDRHPIGAGVGRVALRAAGVVEGMAAVAQSPPSGWLDRWSGSRDFMGDLERGDDERQGPGTVIGAMEVERGRVVYLGDRAAWGETMIGLEGNLRLFHNALSWLLRAEVPPERAPDLIVREEIGLPGCATRTPEGWSALWAALVRAYDRPRCTSMAESAASIGAPAPLLLLHGQPFLPPAGAPPADAPGDSPDRLQIRLVPGLPGVADGQAVRVIGAASGWTGGAIPVRPAPLEGEGWDVRIRDDLGRPVVARQGSRWIVLDAGLFQNDGMGVRDGTGTASRRTGRMLLQWLLEEIRRAG